VAFAILPAIFWVAEVEAVEEAVGAPVGAPEAVDGKAAYCL
jgi:hypothetical protein